MRTPKPWQILQSEYLVRKSWLSVRQDRVRTGTGTIIEEYHVLEVPSWACVICVSERDELILIRQYRHGVSQLTLELPAGVIEPGETPLAGARRELFEETGYTSENWTLLATLTPEPARHTHLAHCFVAHQAVPSHGQSLDASEDVLVEAVPVERTLTLIREGTLTHAVHIAALLLARERGLLPS